jgi:hypothetical protein
VYRFRGLRVAIYLNDHRPPHVHVLGNGCEAVFELGCPPGPPRLRENYGFTLRDLRAIDAELTGRITELCNRWREIHGNEG